MVRLTLGLTTTTQASLNTILDRLRSLSSDEVTITATQPEEDAPEVLSVTFEFGVLSDDAYRALGDQSRAWFHGNSSGVESYRLMRDP
jgi:hypothetical protein